MRQSLESLLGADELAKRELEEKLEAIIRESSASDSRGFGRTTDGVEYVRWVDRGPARAQLCGKVWELPDSALHTFWLVVARDDEGRVRWSLHYDVDPTATSPRFHRDAADLLKSPDEVRWLLFVSSEYRDRHG